MKKSRKRYEDARNALLFTCTLTTLYSFKKVVVSLRGLYALGYYVSNTISYTVHVHQMYICKVYNRTNLKQDPSSEGPFGGINVKYGIMLHFV